MRATVDRSSLRAAERAVTTQALRALSRAVRTQTRGLEKDLEAVTRARVKGRLFRAWQSKVYPKSGLAYEPLGLIYVSGGDRSQGAVTFFTTPGVNRAPDGQWLAIPTRAAGARPRSGMLTPGQWERATGKRLRFVYDGPGEARLVYDVVAMTDAKRRGGQQARTVTVFVLIPFQRHQHRIAIEPFVQLRQIKLAEMLERGVGD